MNRAIEEKIRGVLGQYIYGVDYETLPEALGKRLKEKHLTIAFAESCTGGLASSLVTDIPGSSEYLMGSVVSYTNDVKHRLLGVKQETLDKYTAVSEQTAREMAQGSGKKSERIWASALPGSPDREGGPPPSRWAWCTSVQRIKTEPKSWNADSSGPDHHQTPGGHECTVSGHGPGEGAVTAPVQDKEKL